MSWTQIPSMKRHAKRKIAGIPKVGCNRLLGYMGSIDVRCGQYTIDGMEYKEKGLEIKFCEDCLEKQGAP